MSFEVSIIKQTEAFYRYGHEEPCTLRGRSIADTQLDNCSEDMIYHKSLIEK